MASQSAWRNEPMNPHSLHNLRHRIRANSVQFTFTLPCTSYKSRLSAHESRLAVSPAALDSKWRPDGRNTPITSHYSPITIHHSLPQSIATGVDCQGLRVCLLKPGEEKVVQVFENKGPELHLIATFLDTYRLWRFRTNEARQRVSMRFQLLHHGENFRPPDAIIISCSGSCFPGEAKPHLRTG